LGLIPKSFFDAIATGDLLQVLLISILTGVVVTGLGERAAGVSHAIDTAGQIFFRIIGLIVKLAPIGAFGAIYHPVGTAMLVSHAQKLGRDIGVNGVWG
ncbi:cation:dicarboxylate symporter family transporter, partial [Klebsiella pneumoniae]|uniref:cation:dicarboxylate symporter family transporter n=1 Tax=Klebsiella pneumoniae TaxID=573 RepID=UPI0013D13BB4